MKTKQQLRKILEAEVAEEREEGIKNAWWMSTKEFHQWEADKKEWIEDVLLAVDEMSTHLDNFEESGKVDDIEGLWSKPEIRERVKQRKLDRLEAEETILEDAIEYFDYINEYDEDGEYIVD